jgi:arylformamidase
MKDYNLDWDHPLDISMPLSNTSNNVSAWYVGPPKFEPVVNGDWIGDVNKGGSVNFRDIIFNPHGHGTHTECVGHISKENYTINQCLKKFIFTAELITVQTVNSPEGDYITAEELKNKIQHKNIEAIIIRTLPNDDSKLSRKYSNTNPPYLHHDAAAYIVELGIKHLLIDLPSVDPENDGGKLLAHHSFWQYPENTRTDATITELIYVPDFIKDGKYILNIQIAPFENDASPSKPVLYKCL